MLARTGIAGVARLELHGVGVVVHGGRAGGCVNVYETRPARFSDPPRR